MSDKHGSENNDNEEKFDINDWLPLEVSVTFPFLHNPPDYEDGEDLTDGLLEGYHSMLMKALRIPSMYFSSVVIKREYYEKLKEELDPEYFEALFGYNYFGYEDKNDVNE